MNFVAAIFFIVCGGALLAVPRRWAPVPLLVGACYMTMGSGIEIGPASLPFYRMLLLVGFMRVLLKGEYLIGRLETIDKLILALGTWMVFASFFHEKIPGAGPVYMCGKMMDLGGVYFLFRVWLSDREDIRGIIMVVALLLVPVSIGMLFEKMSGKNPFSIFGGVPEDIIVRNGKARAQGPFRHPILAGTVGATCVPLFCAIWNTHRKIALAGILAGVGMTFASASSGPVLSMAGGLGAVFFWKFRHWSPFVIKAGIAVYLFLSVVMSQPPYYLISKIDITGGSTGWHRAFLIDTTIQHFNEWFLFGTDRTRHWMPRQGAINEYHTDITNYYIGYAVQGGLLALGLLVSIVILCFVWVGRMWRDCEDENLPRAYFVWCCGACLLAHAATSLSVAYFDQSMIFLWLAVAVICSLWASWDDETASLEEGVESEYGDDLEGVFVDDSIPGAGRTSK